MVKGHPTILYETALKNNNASMLPYFKQYLDNPDGIFERLIDYYHPRKFKEDNTYEKLDYCQKVDIVKNIFNIAIYGGNHKTWLEQLEKDNIYVENVNRPHDFVTNFIKNCESIINLIYDTNPDLVSI
jgi:hypothetical protein